MSNPPVITNRAPLPGAVAKINDGIRLGFKMSAGGMPVAREKLSFHVGYGTVRWEGEVLPENGDYEFQLDSFVGNPAPDPDGHADISIEGDGSLKIDKYLAGDYQKGWYSCGRLESPAAVDATIMAEATVRINSSDMTPDGNDYTGVMFGLFSNDGGCALKFFDDGATRWVELHDAAQGTVSSPGPAYSFEYDWDGVASNYKILWDPYNDVVMVILSSGQDEITADIVLIDGKVSDFAVLPTDQQRDHQPIGFFGHTHADPVGISYWGGFYLYHEVTFGLDRGVFQGGHEGVLNTDSLVTYNPKVTPDRSHPAWMLYPDSFDDIEGAAEVTGGVLTLWRDVENASFGYYRVEPVVFNTPVLLDFVVYGDVYNQVSGMQASGIEVWVDNGVYSARVGFLWDYTNRAVGILGTGLASRLGSYEGAEIDWTLRNRYRLIFDPSGTTILYKVETSSGGALRYVRMGDRDYTELPSTSMPGPGIGFGHNATIGQAKAKMVLESLRYLSNLKSWTADALPAAPWAVTGGGGTPYLEDGLLVLEDESDSDVLYYVHVEPSYMFNQSIGFSVDFRMVIDSYEVGGVNNPGRNNTGVAVEIDDGAGRLTLMFANAGPEIGNIVYFVMDPDPDDTLFDIRSGRDDVASIYAKVDWTVEHTYRIDRAIGGNIQLTIDEASTPVIDVQNYGFQYLGSVDLRVLFGSVLDDRKSKSRWSFFHYSTSTGLDLKIDQVRDEEDRFDRCVNVIAVAGDVLKESFSGAALPFDTVVEYYEDFEEEWGGVGTLSTSFSGTPVAFD